MLKETTIKDIVQYLKNFSNQHTDLENEPNKITLIQNVYSDIDIIFNKYNPSITPLTKQQISFFTKIYKDAVDKTGGLVYIRRKDCLIDNVAELSINSFYPNIIRLFHLIGIMNELSYSFLVENKKEITSRLTPEEYKSFKIILNYKYGILWKYNQEEGFKISTFGKILLENIITIDNLYDIVYIDTDSIFFYYTEETYNKLNNYLSILFTTELEHCGTCYFIDKKKYMKFENIDMVKLKGIRPTPFYVNKDIKNYAYNHWCRYGNDKTYSDFIIWMMKENIELFNKSKQIVKRIKKLKRILHD